MIQGEEIDHFFYCEWPAGLCICGVYRSCIYLAMGGHLGLRLVASDDLIVFTTVSWFCRGQFEILSVQGGEGCHEWSCDFSSPILPFGSQNTHKLDAT